MPFGPGQILDEKYRIDRIIGEGGMGAVYEGENLLIRRRVAIKVLNVPSFGSTDAIVRFEREAQAAGEIGNDHIMEVFDLGALDSGDRYMVMEFLDGETLAERIGRVGRISPEDVAPLTHQFLSGLAAAHAAGIIHRDLKPDNIFIVRNKAGRADFVKIIDFGISKFSRGGREMHLTRTGAVMGTPCYMSPEQARGSSEADVRSDIYAVGVILYKAVTGQLPFDSPNFNDLMFKIVLSDPPLPSHHVPGLDPGFESIIRKAMSRAPEDRYQTVQELSAALTSWQNGTFAGETLAGSTIPTPSNPGGVDPDATGPRTTFEAKNSNLRRGAALGGALALGALALVFVWMRGFVASRQSGESVGVRMPDAPQVIESRVDPPAAPAAVANVEPKADKVEVVDAGVRAPKRPIKLQSAAPSAHPTSGRPASPAGSAKSKSLDFGY
jgi:serine/threonine protein kinase